MRISRPTGFSLLALALWWLSLGAIAGLFVFHFGSIFLIGCFFYAVTAFVCAYGLWKMKPWVVKSFLCWTVVVLFLSTLFEFTLLKDPIILFAVFMAIMILILWGLYSYINSNVKKTLVVISK